MTPLPANARAVRFRDLFADSKESYELANLKIAKRVGGLAFAVGLLVVFILLPVDAPTHHVGEGGWLFAGAFIVVSITVSVRLLRWAERVTPNELLVYSYLILTQIVMLQWLGGRDAAYMELFLIAALYTAAVHPPLRVMVYLVALVLAACSPLVYEGWDETVGLKLAAHVVLWTGLSLLTMQFVRLSRQDLRREGDALRELAHADPLTRVGNRRAFDDTLARAVAGARRWDRPFSILVADLTGFKGINDRFGHLEGDRCLREVGDALRSTVRTPDACFRWGGDEFAFVLPATDLAAAQLVGGRLRRAVEQRVTLPDGEPLHISWAAAQFEDGMDAEALLAAADARLMGGKGGSARTRVAPRQRRV